MEIYSIRDKEIYFYLYSDEIDDYLPDCKAFLTDNAHCSDCESPINKEFNPCACQSSVDIEDGCIGMFFVNNEVERFHLMVNKEVQRKSSKERSEARRDREYHSEGFFKREDVKTIFDAQQGKCYYCGIDLGAFTGKGKYSIDHITPLSHCGSQWPNNIAIACKKCNIGKGTKSEKAYFKKLSKSLNKEWLIEREFLRQKLIKLKNGITRARRKERCMSVERLGSTIIKEMQIVAKSKGITSGCDFQEMFNIEEYENCLHISLETIMLERSSISLSLPSPPQKLIKKWSKDNIKEISSVLVDGYCLI